MCILIEISIKIYFMDIAAGNGPKVQSDRAPATNRRQAHETSTRTHARDNTHTTRTHARDNTHTARTHTIRQCNARPWKHTQWRSRTHTRRRRARTLVRTRLRHARMHTRRPCKARSWTHAHDGHARMRARTHAFVPVVVKGERCRYSMTATLECVSIAHQATLCDWRMWYSHICVVNLDTCRGQKGWVSTNN